MPERDVFPHREKEAMADDRQGDRFLHRWSKRKLDDDRADDIAGADKREEPQPVDEEDEVRRLQLQENREAAEAIDLDSLDADSDLSPFFNEGVPKVLKAAALRAVWRSNPVFANLDGLNDYDENFADPELVKKFIGSAWKVGKGYFTDDDMKAEGTEIGVAENVERTDTAGTPQEPKITTSQDGESSEERTILPESEQVTGDEPVESEIAAETGNEPDQPERVPLRTRLALDDWG